MAGSPDLFVVCKNCGSEVSPYITECPYCGNRLRKRAPKLERDEDGSARARGPKIPRPSLGPLRAGEIPGIRPDRTGRPYVTIALVVASLAGLLVLSFASKADVAFFGPFSSDGWWRAATSPFVYDNPWYEFAAVLVIAIFGWLLEHRHGPLLVLALAVACGPGAAAAAAAADSTPIILGGNGLALGLVAAWAVPVLLARRAGLDDDDDHDLLGVGVLALVVALMPIATRDASVVAGAVGLVAGALAGLLLARLQPRR